MDMDQLKKIKVTRGELIPIIARYYDSIGREVRPKYEDYSLQELRKCIVMFEIALTRS
jgi:hypothetical protein